MERTPDFGRISTPELAVVLTIALLPAGCGKFESSPYALPTEAMPHDLNELNRARLAAREPYDDDTVTMVFTGDIQRFYQQQDAIVAKAKETVRGIAETLTQTSLPSSSSVLMSSNACSKATS